MIRHAVRDSQCILTASEFTKKDIVRSFGVHENKVVTVHLGVDSQFRPVSESKKQKFRIQRNLKRPYVLFVGNPKPHKGIPTLLRAFARIAGSFPALDLVFVGGRITQDSFIRSIIQVTGIGGRVRELERISANDLVRAYNCAEILVIPSLYEGFGLPALEAMSCGTCVVVSDAGSLPEIAGDSALVFHRGDPESLAESMASLLRDRRLRSTMIERGKKRVRSFSWKETAKKTLAVYERVLS
jgi:glycosyltransferase involved in cell wall biosynthesis